MNSIGIAFAVIGIVVLAWRLERDPGVWFDIRIVYRFDLKRALGDRNFRLTVLYACFTAASFAALCLGLSTVWTGDFSWVGKTAAFATIAFMGRTSRRLARVF